jgi:hypothetical protein
MDHGYFVPADIAAHSQSGLSSFSRKYPRHRKMQDGNLRRLQFVIPEPVFVKGGDMGFESRSIQVGSDLADISLDASNIEFPDCDQHRHGSPSPPGGHGWHLRI